MEGPKIDSKLTWSIHVANAICKAKKALFALRLIKRFFTDEEMRTLLDANFYSVLYYNSVKQQYQSFPVWVLCIGRMDVVADGTGFRA